MKKKKTLIIISIIVVSFITLCTLINKENTLSMMLETSAGSGQYEPSNDTKWPTDGYQ